MEWSQVVGSFVEDRRGRGAARLTVTAYRGDLSAFATWYRDTTGEEPDVGAVTPIDVADWRAFLARDHKPATTNRRVGTLRTLFGWAVTEGLVRVNPASQVRAVAQVTPAPRALDRRALGRLLRAAQRSGPRDVALVTVLAQCGLRIGEALALTWGDVVMRERSGQVTVRQGKGMKRRDVPLTLTARRALEAWRGTRRPAEAEPWAPVFPGRGGRPLTRRAAEAAFKRLSRGADLEEGATPHTLRHSFCKVLVDAGEPLPRVAALAGHASVATTARCAQPTKEDLEAAVARREWT